MTSDSILLLKFLKYTVTTNQYVTDVLNKSFTRLILLYECINILPYSALKNVTAKFFNWNFLS